VKWQDGVPFTAHDVAFTYNYILDNNLSAYASYLALVKSVTAPDDSTVVITCSRAKANMLSLWIPIVPEHIWSKIPGKAAENTFVNKPPIIGTGPFQTVEVQKSRYVRMVANKDYWKGAPKIDEILFNTYQNADTMVEELRSGAIDMAWNIPDAQFASLQNVPGLKTAASPTTTEHELCFNAYKGATSLGNPAMRDPAFRQALNWAIDRKQIVQVAYGGYATPGSSIIPSGFYTPTLDWHWEPPADMAYGFDLNKAKALLDAAGYKDTDGDGIRNDPHTGKDVSLRLWARSESSQSQRCGSLITGWFRAVGLKINYQVMEDGVISDKNYNTTKSGAYAPDYDMYIWGWGWDIDPDFAMSVFTTAQVNSWADSAWTDPAFDALYIQQQTAIDPQQRKQIVWRMEEMLYKESPYIVLAYPKDLEAWDVAHWDGWVQSPPKAGDVFYTATNLDTYLYVHPKTAAATTEGSNTSWIAAIVVAAITAAVVAFLLLRRRRPKAVEE
jgi:peptide/nickel transport system substrate-binding protein